MAHNISPPEPLDLTEGVAKNNWKVWKKAHGQLESVQRSFLTVHIMSLQMVLHAGKTFVICLSYQQINQSLQLLKYPRNLPT